MSTIVEACRTPKEKFYGLAMIVGGAVLWPSLIFGILAIVGNPNPRISTVGDLYLFYGLAFAAFIWLSSAFYKATAFGNFVLLGPNQFPQLHAMVVEGAQALGLKRPPQTFLYNSNGLMNAFARRLLGGQFVFLTSALVEVTDDAQIRFVIGHELGHHAAGHLNPWLNALKLPARMIPFLYPAYSRAREFTCDGIGARLCEDVVVSRRALQMLGCGCRRLNATMNCEAFMAQEAMVPPLFGYLSERFRSHPRLTRRLAALKAPRAA